MIFTSKESLDDAIIRLLLEKKLTVKKLQQRLIDEDTQVTSQGIYKVLSALLSIGVVIKRGFFYALDEEWRSRVIKKLSTNTQGLSLAEGEKIRFDLTSLVHLDQQWKNLVLPLHQAHPNDPIFLYNPHEIWLHLNEQRKASEYSYYASFAEKQTYAFCVLGGNTIHDQAMKKELQSEYLQVAVGVEYFAPTDYPAIFNDYIVTTRLTPKLAAAIEDCYQQSTTMAVLEERLQTIGIEKKKIKLTVERNKEKAKQLRKRMSREFYVPRHLTADFDLY